MRSSGKFAPGGLIDWGGLEIPCGGGGKGFVLGWGMSIYLRRCLDVLLVALDRKKSRVDGCGRMMVVLQVDLYV